MVLKTQYCHRVGHPEISISFDGNRVLSTDAEWLINYLDAKVQEGDVFEAGSTIQIGWMVNRFEMADGKLWLFEPDFRIIPIEFVNSVDRTLVHLRLQKDINDSVEIKDYSFPVLNQSGIICTHFLSQSDLFMERTTPSDRDSGWFFGCISLQHDHNDPACLRRVSLYETICAKPHLVEFLALPSGIRINLKKRVEVWLNGSELRPKEGSYLFAKLLDQDLSGET